MFRQPLPLFQLLFFIDPLMVTSTNFSNRSALYIANLEQNKPAEVGFGPPGKFSSLVLCHSEHDAELHSQSRVLSLKRYLYQDFCFVFFFPKMDSLKIKEKLAVRSLRSSTVVPHRFKKQTNKQTTFMPACLAQKRKNSRLVMIFSKQIDVSKISWQNGSVY